jgi:hypothetical protein
MPCAEFLLRSPLLALALGPLGVQLIWPALIMASFLVGTHFIMRSQWGRRHPAARFVLWSILVHVLLVYYASRTWLGTTPTAWSHGNGSIEVTFLDDVAEADETPVATASDAVTEPSSTATVPRSVIDAPSLLAPRPSRDESAPSQPVADASTNPRPASVAPPSAIPPTSPPATDASPSESAPASLLPPDSAEAPASTTPSDSAAPATASDESLRPAPSVDVPRDSAAPNVGQTGREYKLPTKIRTQGGYLTKQYAQRDSAERQRLAAASGGGPNTEAAVEAALVWLATHQEPDGRWDASRWGSNHEARVLGHDRGAAGTDADTGITGLALLAFLAAGQTHTGGDYQHVVGRGIDFLITSQRTDGSLSGDASLFAQTYCHSIATLALSEAYAMTADRRLQWPVERAIDFTIRGQNAQDGGWRYRPGDRGDMSQFGWQVMACYSARAAGVAVPDSTVAGMHRFLAACSQGPHRGLAAYRPGERVTPTMTAEALVCRIFLDQQVDPATAREAIALVSAEPPGSLSIDNFYYYYYGTLAMHQLGGPEWNEWNARLVDRLVSTQRRDGELAGSWDPNCLWGGYGGRVYTTALGALCLEVYYRYLPLVRSSGQWTADESTGLPRR